MADADFDNSTDYEESKNRRIKASCIFGFFVGLAMGGLVGWKCAAYLGAADHGNLAMYLGETVGVIFGLVVAMRAAKTHQSQSGPSIASTICAVIGLAPTILILIGGLGGLRGGRALIGIAFAWPMGGLLAGGVLDRLFEITVWRKNCPTTLPPSEQ